MKHDKHYTSEGRCGSETRDYFPLIYSLAVASPGQLPLLLASCLSFWPLASPPTTCLAWPVASPHCQFPLLASYFSSLPIGSFGQCCLSWGSYTLAHTRWTKADTTSASQLQVYIADSENFLCHIMVLFPV